MPGSREADFFVEIMHFHYVTYMAPSQHKNPCPGVMNGRPFLGHHCTMPQSREKDLSRNTSILHFYHKITFHEIHNFCLTGATFQIWLRLA